MPRNSGIASGESTGRKPGGWDETVGGAGGNDARVGVQGRSALPIDSICRTAGYVTRPYGGVGGGGAARLPPIPNMRLRGAPVELAVWLDFLLPAFETWFVA